MDSHVLAALARKIDRESMSMHSLSIVRHGYLVYDTASSSYDRSLPHDVASITKSVVTTLLGLAIDEARRWRAWRSPRRPEAAHSIAARHYGGGNRMIIGLSCSLDRAEHRRDKGPVDGTAVLSTDPLVHPQPFRPSGQLGQPASHGIFVRN